MQGRFPIEPRPFARVAELAGLPEDEVLRARPVPARQADHPRDHADLRHARVRLRVDARRGQGRPRQPAPRGPVHQHPPRRHAQLPARPRLQPLVHDRRRARLEAGPGRDARRHAAGDRRRVDPPAADAQAVQDPHGPRDGGRDRRALDRRRGRRADGARADRADRGGHRHGPRDAGPDARRARALRARRPRSSASRSRRSSSGSSRCKRARRPAPRRGDPLPPPRRLLRQRHGRLGGPGGRDPRDRQADGRVPRHLALLPAADLRRLALLGLHDGPRALEGGVRRDPRLDRRGHRASSERATLYSSTEFKKVRMLYFTDAFARWEEEHAR